MDNSMRIALVGDAFPPMCTSAAVQLRDLSDEFARQGYKLTVITPTSDLNSPWGLEEINGVEVLKLRTLKTKGVGIIRRAIAEMVMPFAMLYNIAKSPIAKVQWDGVVSYSPTVFLGPVTSSLKKKKSCRNYLILRDIFPQWTVDLGLINKGVRYYFFKMVERYLYSVADTIGVQTAGNLAYFDRWPLKSGQRVEVLQNWLAEKQNTGCSISIESGPLAGRKIFVYAGNMGIGQDVGILIGLAKRFRGRDDIGFLLVGKGEDAQLIRREIKKSELSNLCYYEEIDSTEIPGLYAQCHVGLIALNHRHKTHHIPGKFLSYMSNGLPVLASVNPDTDLINLIEEEEVGRVCTDHKAETLQVLAEGLLEEIKSSSKISTRCKRLSKKLFTPKAAVKQIMSAMGEGQTQRQ